MKSCDTTPLLAYDDALAQLTDSVTVRVETVEMPLLQARGAILAETVVADIDVPGCAMSAMDGYAVNTADLGADDVTRLPLSQRIAAGDAEATLTPGTAARIFTGAPVPTGADAVIMQEQVEVENGFVSFETINVAHIDTPSPRAAHEYGFGPSICSHSATSLRVPGPNQDGSINPACSVTNTAIPPTRPA